MIPDNKRIAIFMQDLKAGGAERMMLNLANTFSEFGKKVDLVIVRKEGHYLKLLSKKVNVVYLESRKTFLSLFPLIRYLRRSKPDVLLSTLVHVNIVAIIAKLLSFSKCKVFVRETNWIKANRSDRNQPFFFRFAYRFVRLVYPLADGVIAVSQKMADSLKSEEHIPDNKIHVIFNPVITSGVFSMAKERPDHPWFHEKSVKIILSAGRLAPQKDFPTLIKAFSRIKADNSCKLVIIGDGKEKGNLQNLIDSLQMNGKIDLAGFQSNPYSFMANCNLFVLSSLWEGSPNVLVEAMACGATVVSTNCPSGPDEILEKGKYGKLVPPGNVDELAAAITYSMQNPAYPSVMISRAELYSAKTSASKYLECFFR